MRSQVPAMATTEISVTPSVAPHISVCEGRPDAVLACWMAQAPSTMMAAAGTSVAAAMSQLS